ncbi:MAG TPA: cytochrome c maturation protein CcmE [Caldisericia bacterium]|nr:cytochrome c maturation protein CcmE [Caldisericia bacterium]HPF49006.1 cytochrome c maturation protein CcmE [Caldisericia bacterium]HPI83130.1 cytochrome c maturation protein CcmE [Caldisericia bacterium]HPQ92357.1 cytochrome c maturation protein CcmE [Caldisericia bacterium]HRV74545.1 cytochrome c maturation protein CcmE [Caldisericia bacterium]
MKNKTTRVIGIILIAALVGLAIYMFANSVTPYTQDFTEAKSGNTVQVWGRIDIDSISGNNFTLLDEAGNSLPIESETMLPPEIESASSTVCVGAWDGDVFVASKILLKCPSKYNEEEEQ